MAGCSLLGIMLHAWLAQRCVCQGHDAKPREGGEMKYAHAANLADGMAQWFMSKGNVYNHHNHNQEPARPRMKV